MSSTDRVDTVERKEPNAAGIGGLTSTALSERVITRIEFFDIGRRGTPRECAKLLPAEDAGDAAAIGASLFPLSDKIFAL